MPIYEFKCMKCEAFFEILVMNSEERAEMKCPECDSENFERVISTTSHTINEASGGQTGTSTQTRTCSSGSCTTYTIPGPNG